MRRAWDAYFTPASAVESLLRVVEISGRVMEPCSGDGAIARPLVDHGCEVVTNDLNPSMHALMHGDATDPAWWRKGKGVPWIVSNPPFSLASTIVPLAHSAATKGVAMLLRLSWLEPCEDRVEFLTKYPPTALIVLPRISFTGDGKSDSVTCAWMVWSKRPAPQVIRIIPKAKPARVEPLFDEPSITDGRVREAARA